MCLCVHVFIVPRSRRPLAIDRSPPKRLLCVIAKGKKGYCFQSYGVQKLCRWRDKLPTSKKTRILFIMAPQVFCWTGWRTKLWKLNSSAKSIVISQLKHSSVVRLINWRLEGRRKSRSGVLRVDLIEFSKEAVTRDVNYWRSMLTIGFQTTVKCVRKYFNPG